MDADLRNSAYEWNVRLGQIFHIPGMITDPDSTDDSLEDFLDDMDDDLVAIIEPHCEGFRDCYKDALEEFESSTESRRDRDRFFRYTLAEFLHRRFTKPWIIQIQYQIVSYINRDEQFPCGRYRSGWGHYQNEWVVAESAEEAIQKGIEASTAHIRAEWEKAPLRQKQADADAVLNDDGFQP